MTGQRILLRVVEAGLEGWKVMELEELLERFDLDRWSDTQEFLGIVLPVEPARLN